MKGATKGHGLHGFTYLVFTESRPVETEDRSVGARGEGECEGTFWGGWKHSNPDHGEDRTTLQSCGSLGDALTG